MPLAVQTPCVDGKQHKFLPATTDTYRKYRPLTDEEKAKARQAAQGYNYRADTREEINEGVEYQTLYCSGCGTSVEIVAANHATQPTATLIKECFGNAQQ